MSDLHARLRAIHDLIQRAQIDSPLDALNVCAAQLEAIKEVVVLVERIDERLAALERVGPNPEDPPADPAEEEAWPEEPPYDDRQGNRGLNSERQ
jgi:hypothetical protein